MPFTHLDDRGKARIVDINPKPITERTATARAVVVIHGYPITSDMIASATAAGLFGAKQTSNLIPLCHPIPLGNIDIAIEVGASVVITATAHATWRTGVEMEALTAVTIAGLELVAAIGSDARIDNIAIVEKRGGKSDPWGSAVTAK